MHLVKWKISNPRIIFIVFVFSSSLWFIWHYRHLDDKLHKKKKWILIVKINFRFLFIDDLFVLSLIIPILKAPELFTTVDYSTWLRICLLLHLIPTELLFHFFLFAKYKSTVAQTLNTETKQKKKTKFQKSSKSKTNWCLLWINELESENCKYWYWFF